MAESEKTHRVVIVGAGFAGFNAARELVQLVGATTEVVVINSTDYFLYLPSGLSPLVAGGSRPASWGSSFRSAAGSYRVGASTLGRESWRQGEAAAKGRARPLAASETISPPASIERAIQVGSQRGLHGPQSASFDWRGGRHARCHRQ